MEKPKEMLQVMKRPKGIIVGDLLDQSLDVIDNK